MLPFWDLKIIIQSKCKSEEFCLNLFTFSYLLTDFGIKIWNNPNYRAILNFPISKVNKYNIYYYLFFPFLFVWK